MTGLRPCRQTLLWNGGGFLLHYEQVFQSGRGSPRVFEVSM